MLTLIVMFVQLPLIAKQTRSMILMQRVQPEIKKIQQKYKDDRAKQNEELLKYYQENKINPLAGCLPLLLITARSVSRCSAPSATRASSTTSRGRARFAQAVHRHLRQAPTDRPGTVRRSRSSTARARRPALPRACTSTCRPRTPCPDGIGTAFPYFILLALVILTGWYQVRQTQARQAKSGGAAPNAQMQAVTKIMPVFFGVISYGFSAATTIYFVVSNVWRIGQQHFVLNKMYEEEHGGRKRRREPTGNEGLEDADRRHRRDAGDRRTERPKPVPERGPTQEEAEALTMDWIEVTARTVDEAKELALDRLGVVEDELEFEVVDEARKGLFGIGRGDARIRARVKPISREKPSDRKRRRRPNERSHASGQGGGGRSGGGGRGGGGSAAEPAAARPSARPRTRRRAEPRPADQPSEAKRSRPARAPGQGGAAAGGVAEAEGAEGRATRACGLRRDGAYDSGRQGEAEVDVETVPVAEQAEHAAKFTDELVRTMGFTASVRTEIDEDDVTVHIEGDGLGALVGPRGVTIQALEEVVRAVVQHHAGGHSAWIHVDVAGYRERRRQALAEFARQVAAEVVDSRAARPMPRCIRSALERRRISRPSSSTSPKSAGNAPLIRLKKVLLPAPFGPITAESDPDGKASDTSSMALRPPNALVRFLISSFIASVRARLVLENRARRGAGPERKRGSRAPEPDHDIQ